MVDLYRAVWRVTGRQQLLLIVLSVLAAALAAAPLKLQQLVVNSLVEGGTVTGLLWLCAGFVAVVLASAGLKFVLNLRLSLVGEGVVLLIRERLYGNAVHDAAAGRTDGPGRGALVTMLTVEAEAVGAFAGAAIASPLLQIGTLASVLVFIFASQPSLGLVAILVVVPQAAIVLAIQGRINGRVRERVQALRDASERISQSDLAALDDVVVDDFRIVFATRRRIFVLKATSKLVLGTISALGAVAILFWGGWLVLEGRSDVGTVVASLAGLARIDGPWRELLRFFRGASTVRVKHEMLVRALEARH